MPIYAYKCESCGFAKDVLQKISDTPLSECPSCGAQTYRKQLTAAGFQLKGSGWYVTDFRDGGKGGAAAKSDDKPADSGASKTDTATPAAKPAEKSAPAPAAEAASKKAATTPSTGSDT
ncbi:MAG: FmdB family zinc ribbon protein [Burkholderiaceae bacterium]